ncbi:hypothetical protein C8R43DRAFT_955705 [Mycena crocata]|nr:hypothetical protein C8R43DRAFT_955705 [Mycena crocata]
MVVDIAGMAAEPWLIESTPRLRTADWEAERSAEERVEAKGARDSLTQGGDESFKVTPEKRCWIQAGWARGKSCLVLDPIHILTSIMSTTRAAGPTNRSLAPTNLPAEEMIPDTSNPAHDPRYWCLPPVREKESAGDGSGRFKMYLVTQGRSVGVWRSWTIVKALVDCYPSGAQRGHNSMRGCIEEWQMHCPFGVHPHPIDPNVLIARGLGTRSPSLTLPSASTAPPISPVSSAAPLRMSSLSTESTVTESWAAVPENVRYFAIWQQGVVYGDRQEAKTAFLKAQARGGKHQVLSTSWYDEAQAFSEGIHWIAD